MTVSQEDFENRVNSILPKTEGTGIRVDQDSPTFPWVDLIGAVQPNVNSPSTSPSVLQFQTGVNAYAYNSGDILDCVYHIPHDWLPNSDAHVHLHWGNDTALVEGDTFTITPKVIYGSRDGVFSSPALSLEPITYTAPAGGLAQYSHPVTEVGLCVAGGSSTALNSADIEVDGLVLVTFVVTSEDITGNLFIFTGDIHHQSTGIGTKNNAAPFYA